MSNPHLFDDGDDNLPPHASPGYGGSGDSRENGSRGGTRSSRRTGTPGTPEGPRADLKPCDWEQSDFYGQYHIFKIESRFPVPGAALVVDHQKRAKKEAQAQQLEDALDDIRHEHGVVLKSKWRRMMLQEKISFDTSIGDLCRRTETFLCDVERRNNGPALGESVRNVTPEARVVFLEFLGHVRKNDLYNVERMLRRGLVESVDTREEVLGDSSLHVACGKGSAPMARLLLQGGANPNVANDLGQVAVHRVWSHWGKKGSGSVAKTSEREATMQMLRDLLAFGADPSVPQQDGWTPLHAAARHGPVHAVLLLLLFKADPYVTDNRGRSPLDIARERASQSVPHKEIVGLLRAWGTIRKEVYNYEFLNSWKGFCTDANMRLGTTPSLEHIMANVDAEQERRALTRCELPMDAWGMPVFDVVDEVLTGPIDILDMTPQPLPVRIRAEQVVLRKGKIRPPRYPTNNRLDVPLDQFLLGEAGVKFLKRPKGTLSDDEPPAAAIAKVKEELPPAMRLEQRYATIKDKVLEPRPLMKRRRAAALHLTSDVQDPKQVHRSGLYSVIHAPIRLVQVKEEGVYLLGKKERSNLDISGRPKTGAYLGIRLVPRRRATAREIDEQARKEALQAVPTSKFTEERDIPKTKKAQFSPDDVIAGRSVTRLQKLPDEEHLHASHPRMVERRANTRALVKYKGYEEPWVGTIASTVPKWDM